MLRNLMLIGVVLVLAGCNDDAGKSTNTTSTSAGTNKPKEGASSKPAASDDKNDSDKKEDGDAKADMKEEKAPAEGGGTDGKAAAEDKKPTDEAKPEATEEKPAGESAAKENPKDEPVAEKKAKVSVRAAFQAAQKAFQEGNQQKAVEELEKAVPDNPEDQNLLLNLAALCQQVGKNGGAEPDYSYFKKSADYLRQALKADPKLQENPNIAQLANGIYYNEACALSKEDKTAEALKSLEAAIGSGYDDLAALEKDEDLVAVRAVPDFADFLTKARTTIEENKKLALERKKKEIEELLASNKPFDFTFDLTDIEGNAISKADLKGKVAIIDVWGTWCPPCRMEIPHFVELQTKFKEAGLEIVGLNEERGKKGDAANELIKEFHKENNMNYRCALISDEVMTQIPNFQGFPTTLFLDRNGVVRAKLVGYNEMAALELIVTTLLEEKAEGAAPAEGAKPEEKTDKAAEEPKN